MSSRTEIEKRRTQEAGSPLINHSMNQISLNRSYQGERRMTPPRKLAMVQIQFWVAITALCALNQLYMFAVAAQLGFSESF